VVFAIWLLFGALGSFLGTFVRRRARPWLNVLVLVYLATLLGALVGLRLWRGALTTTSGQVIPLARAFLWMSLFGAPVAAVCGALYSVALAAQETFGGLDPRRAYAFDALGDLVGGAACSFLFVRVFPHTSTAALAALCLGATLLVFSRLRRAPVPTALGHGLRGVSSAEDGAEGLTEPCPSGRGPAPAAPGQGLRGVSSAEDGAEGLTEPCPSGRGPVPTAPGHGLRGVSSAENGAEGLTEPYPSGRGPAPAAPGHGLRGVSPAENGAEGLTEPYPSRRGLVAAAICCVFAAVFVASWRIEDASQAARWRSMNADFSVLEVANSPYGETAVVRLSGSSQRDFFENGYYSFSVPHPYEAYTTAPSAHLIASVHPAPKRMLLVGGLGTVLPEILRHPLERIDCVELDPAMVALLRRHLSSGAAAALDDPRVSLHLADGRAFVSSSPAGRYDIVAVLAGEPLSLSTNRYFTVEFFREARRALAPGGVFVLSLSVDPGAQEEMILRAGVVGATLAAVFRRVVVTPAGFAVAGDDRFDLSAATLAANYRAHGAQSDFFHPALFETMLQPAGMERVARLMEPYLSGAGPLNTDAEPTAVWRALLLWGSLVGGGDAALYRVLTGVRLWHLLAAAALLLALGMLARRRRVRTYVAVGVAGANGMAAGLAVIHAFQSAVGTAYALIGALTGLFMLGVAIGASLARRVARRRLWLSVAVAASAAIVFLTPLGLRMGRVPAAFLLCVLNLLAGVTVGVVYGVATSSLESTASSGGRVFAADLAGATCGALVFGCALLLTGGISACAWAAAALAAAALLPVALRSAA